MIWRAETLLTSPVPLTWFASLHQILIFMSPGFEFLCPSSVRSCRAAHEQRRRLDALRRGEHLEAGRAGFGWETFCQRSSKGVRLGFLVFPCGVAILTA